MRGRSADVVAAGPVEVPMGKERFLSRIQSRSARIAAKLFLKLTHILSHRLGGANQHFVAARSI